MDDFANYEEMRDRGTPAAEAYLTARTRGLDEITSIRMLRRVFGLSLADAKRVTGASEAFESKQRVAIGGKVYWEGWSTVEGFYIMEARMAAITASMVQVTDHKKYRWTSEGLEEVEVLSPAITRIPISYFDKTLGDRLAASIGFLERDSGEQAGHHPVHAASV